MFHFRSSHLLRRDSLHCRITGITGCAGQSGAFTTNCNRAGGDKITISGLHFGQLRSFPAFNNSERFCEQNRRFQRSSDHCDAVLRQRRAQCHDAESPADLHHTKRCEIHTSFACLISDLSDFPGSGNLQSVTLLQNQGDFSSSPGFISYQPCAAGSYVSGTNCPAWCGFPSI